MPNEICDFKLAQSINQSTELWYHATINQSIDRSISWCLMLTENTEK